MTAETRVAAHRRASAIAVLGTSSGAGKSLLTAGLCASLRRRGFRVAPFKAQNMSNNSRVVDGGEIGAAQWFQAIASQVNPSIHHNPVLLKPEADTRSQVVVHGRVDRALTEMPWRTRAPLLWDAIAESYDRVARDADIVVIEGAGSPAETNLVDVDLVNHRAVHHADASALLVCDIDRGGAFAHLFGTWTLVGDELRPRIRGFVLNKFRGDPLLLAPAPEQLRARTGVPTVGVVPMVDHGLPDEDGADPRPTVNGPKEVRVVRGPAASNLDEWWPLRATTSFQWATEPGHLAGADLMILPGSKLAAADLDWMRRTKMDDAIVHAIASGVQTIAVCGGAQILGHRIDDPFGVERGATGLGVLPYDTTFGTAKTVQRTTARCTTNPPLPWAALADIDVSGYEIRFGRTTFRTAPERVLPADLGFAFGNVLCTYLHGLFENDTVLRAITGSAHPRPLATVVDGLADLIDSHLDVDAILQTVDR